MLVIGTPKTPFSLKNFIAGMTCPTPGSPHIPRQCTPAHSSVPGTTAHDRRQDRPCKARHTRPDAGHAALVCTRYQTGRAGWIDTAAGRWRACSSSIMRIMIALSQAWYIDSNMNKYHKDILLFLVIVNCYLSIDIPFY